MSRDSDFESSRIQVLHVDNDANFADLVKNRLEHETDRISVQIAAAPEEGLSVVATEAIDCIVSDYDMPTQNGVEFLQSVREEYPDLPFILYTSKGSEEIASEAISADVTDTYKKKQARPTIHYWQTEFKTPSVSSEQKKSSRGVRIYLLSPNGSSKLGVGISILRPERHAGPTVRTLYTGLNPTLS